MRFIKIICPDGSEANVDCLHDMGIIDWNHSFFFNKEGWFSILDKYSYYIKNNKVLALPDSSGSSPVYFCYLDLMYHSKEEIERIVRLKAFL